MVSDSVECILIEVKADKYSLGGSPTLSQRSRTTKTDTHPHLKDLKDLSRHEGLTIPPADKVKQW